MNSQSSPSGGASGPLASPPLTAARFMLHLKQHGMAYAIGWLILDATGAWATVTGQVVTMC